MGKGSKEEKKNRKWLVGVYPAKEQTNKLIVLKSKNGRDFGNLSLEEGKSDCCNELRLHGKMNGNSCSIPVMQLHRFKPRFG